MLLVLILISPYNSLSKIAVLKEGQRMASPNDRKDLLWFSVHLFSSPFPLRWMWTLFLFIQTEILGYNLNLLLNSNLTWRKSPHFLQPCIYLKNSHGNWWLALSTLIQSIWTSHKKNLVTHFGLSTLPYFFVSTFWAGLRFC